MMTTSPKTTEPSRAKKVSSLLSGRSVGPALVVAGMISCQVRSASSPSTKVYWVAVKS
jgi:hypothetical protein